MKIYIDAGHSTKTGDPGATSGSFIEYDINCKVAKACNDYLKANYTCDTILDYDTSTSGNISKSISNKCDAFLCIHHNAGGGDGCEVYYWTGDARAKALAESVINEFKAIGQNSRGVKMSTKSAYNFAPCRENSKAGIPAILGEFAFVDNITDRTIIDSESELIAEGQAYAKGVAKFLSLPQKASQIPVTPVAPNTPELYQVKIIDRTGLNYRPNPAGNPILGQYQYGKVISIYEESGKWGKTGDGYWICIAPIYVEKIVPQVPVVEIPVVVEPVVTPPVVETPIIVTPPIVEPVVETPTIINPPIVEKPADTTLNIPSIFKDIAGLLKRLLKVKDRI